MMNKKKLLLAVAAALLSGSIAATAFAANDKFSVKADELEYDMQTGEGRAKGHVVLIQDTGKATATNAIFNSKSKTGRLIGNVIVEREDATLNCGELIMHSEDYISAIGSAVLVKEGKTLSAERIDYYKTNEYAETIGGWARLTDVDGSVLDAGKIDYDMQKGVANAAGGVVIDSPARKLTATADKVVYETKANGHVELIGNAKATQDGNSVSGDKLRLTNSNVASAEGNVKIIYIPQEQPAKKDEENQELA